ncbi:MAG: hypothetical protein SFW67_33020 [Myxococcaceae bacterium]|nr:hypothetical protein [Myxococcaceae bacterium]
MSAIETRLVELLDASREALLELSAFAAFLVVVDRRLDGRPLEAIDAIGTVGFSALATLLVLRTVAKRERSLSGWGRVCRLPHPFLAPTASWAHLAWGFAWFTIGWGLGGRPGAVLLALSGLLLAFRALVIWWRRRH